MPINTIRRLNLCFSVCADILSLFNLAFYVPCTIQPHTHTHTRAQKAMPSTESTRESNTRRTTRWRLMLNKSETEYIYVFFHFSRIRHLIVLSCYHQQQKRKKNTCYRYEMVWWKEATKHTTAKNRLPLVLLRQLDGRQKVKDVDNIYPHRKKILSNLSLDAYEWSVSGWLSPHIRKKTNWPKWMNQNEILHNYLSFIDGAGNGLIEYTLSVSPVMMPPMEDMHIKP